MSNLKIIVSNPGYGSHVKQSILAYNEANMLHTFCTAFLIPNNFITRTLRKKFKGIKSKQFDTIPANKIKKLQFPEIIRLMSSKYLSVVATDKVWEWSELYFDNWVSKKIKNSIDVFHGYEHACLFSLKKCKSENIFSVYEQPSAHHQYVNENIIKPLQITEEYFNTNFKELYNSELSSKRNLRRDKELETANLVICNSTYVKNTLIYAGLSESKIAVIPLGFPEVNIRDILPVSELRFIVSGNLSYLKGTHHVLRVWRNNQDLFNKHKLICIGSNSLSEEEWDNLPDNVVRMNRLSSEEYILELEKADVCILNTYSDGFGMVMSEAMAYGLAVIATDHSAAVDIIKNNSTGKVIPIGNEDALLNAMNWMINNEEDLCAMRKAAMQYASEHTWKWYRQNLPKLINEKHHQFKTNG